MSTRNLAFLALLSVALLALAAALSLLLRAGDSSLPIEASPGSSRQEPALRAEPKIAALQASWHDATIPEATTLFPADQPSDLRSSELVVAELAGSVMFPAGAPRDESLQVVILGPAASDIEPLVGGRSWDEHVVLERIQVEADGSFQGSLVISRESASQLQLDVDGRFLFLAEPQEIQLDSEWTASLQLAPELGGAIRGALIAPLGSTRRMQAAHVGVFGMDGSGSITRTTVLGDTEQFELRALPDGLRYTLWAGPDVFPGTVHKGEISVTPGDLVEASVALDAGSCVRGRVVDPAGKPVAGVVVCGDAGVIMSAPLGAGRATTDTSGTFELVGLAARTQSLQASVEGYLDARSENLALVEGELHSDVTLTLDSGVEISGTVRWPDGRPAEDARLTLVPRSSIENTWNLLERARTDEGTARSRSDGTFRIAMLEPADYALFAELRTASSSDDSGPWNARIDSLEAGRDDVELTLRRAVSLAGRIVDDAGAPVSTYVIQARRADWPSWLEDASAVVEVTFEDAQGAFLLEGLDAGIWNVSVRAEGHLRSEELALELPSADSTSFVLTRTATISGTVFDPEGRPVSGAEVRGIATGPFGHMGVVTSDADGHFSLESVGPGSITLRAASEAWAPSLEESVDLASGEARVNHDLYLSNGGRISGQVFGAEGAPDADREVVAMSSEGDAYEALSDASGQFAFEHVAPGTYQVIATPDMTAMPSSGEPDMGDLFRDVRMTMATVTADETTEVVLGAPPRAPVTVHGRVVRNGSSLANAELMVLPENGSVLEGLRADSAGEDGTFEVQLDEPGDYVFIVHTSRSSGSEIEVQATIPEVSRFEIDLVVPSGSVAGRVLSPDGEPLTNAVVWARRLDGASSLSSFLGAASVETDSGGAFRIEDLRAGEYALTAAHQGSAVVTRHGILVDDNTATEGIDLAMGKAGEVTGTVFDVTGQPVVGAEVCLWDGDGRPLFHLDGFTDHEGAFTIRRVPLGQVFVSATALGQVSPAPAAFRIDAENSQLELVVEAGIELLVELVDEEGVPTRAALTVTNEAGIDVGIFAAPDDFEDLATSGADPSQRRFGPLPAGRYRVRASHSDGRMVEKSVTLRAGADERRLRVRLR